MAFPYIKIEPPEYLNNYAINSLTCEEYGAFMRVLLLMWQAEMQLHNDDIYIARQINIEPARWAQIKQKLDRLHLIFDESGNLTNMAIKSKYLAAAAFSRQQAEKKAGKKNRRKVS